MKTAKLFLGAMYLHLILSIAVPVSIFFLCSESGWNIQGAGLLLLYLLMVGAVHVLGWVTAGAAYCAYRRGAAETLRNSWKLLKLGAIPFYILNFLYSFFIWFILVGASRGILIILVPIPVLFTWLLIAQSGCVGICFISCLRQSPESEGRPRGIHFLLQLLPVLDVFSTILILSSSQNGTRGGTNDFTP